MTTSTLPDLARINMYTEDLKWLHICQLIALACTIYDHCIIFTQEIALIWRKQMSVTSALYIVVRYLGDLLLLVTSIVLFTPDISLANCSLYHQFHGWATSCLLFAMQWMLLIRLIAMYRGARYYKATWRNVLIFLFVIQILGISGLLIVGYHSLKVTVEPYPTIRICAAIHVPRWIPAWWVPMGLLDLIMFLFALSVAIGHMRKEEVKEDQNTDTPKRRSFSIMKVIIRDTIPYYVMLLVLNIINSTAWLGLRHHLGAVSQIPQEFSIAVVSIFGCRMMLNLRREAEQSCARGGSQVRTSDVEGMLDHIEMSFGTNERESFDNSETGSPH